MQEEKMIPIFTSRDSFSIRILLDYLDRHVGQSVTALGAHNISADTNYTGFFEVLTSGMAFARKAKLDIQWVNDKGQSLGLGYLPIAQVELNNLVVQARVNEQADTESWARRYQNILTRPQHELQSITGHNIAVADNPIEYTWQSHKMLYFADCAPADQKRLREQAAHYLVRQDVIGSVRPLEIDGTPLEPTPYPKLKTLQTTETTQPSASQAPLGKN